MFQFLGSFVWSMGDFASNETRKYHLISNQISHLFFSVSRDRCSPIICKEIFHSFLVMKLNTERKHRKPHFCKKAQFLFVFRSHACIIPVIYSRNNCKWISIFSRFTRQFLSKHISSDCKLVPPVPTQWIHLNEKDGFIHLKITRSM